MPQREGVLGWSCRSLKTQGDACGERTAVSEEAAAAPALEADYLSKFLLSEASLEELLHQVVSLARRSVPGADSVTVSLIKERGYETPAASDDLGRDLDNTQYKLDEGPCVEALKTHQLVSFRVDEGEPFPRFAEEAASKFVSAVLSTPLHAGAKGIGALNMYSGTLDAYPEDQVETARLFAEQAGVILANGIAYNSSITLNARLQEALLSRDVIGQAKGLIMARESCSGEEAFGRLRVMSQRENRKLRTVAQEVVDAHEQGLRPPR